MQDEILVTRENFIATYENKKLAEFYARKYSYLLPLYATPTLAALVADITGDGHFGKGIIQFISKDKNRALKFATDFDQIFKYKTQIRRSPSNKNVWECLIGGNTIYRFFKIIDTPFGNKTNCIFYVPNWIMNGTDEIKRKYLQHLFDCEGSVSLQKRNRIAIKFEMTKEISKKENLYFFLSELKKILKEFDIKTTNIIIRKRTNLRVDGSRSTYLGLEIYGTRKNYTNILNFWKEINFVNSIKREKLKRYLEYIINAPLN
jgi:intein/homing endonuclease